MQVVDARPVEVMVVQVEGGYRRAKRLSDGRWECLAVEGYRVHLAGYTDDRGAAARYVETGAALPG